MTDENSGHYVIASSRPPERRLLERRTLAPKVGTYGENLGYNIKKRHLFKTYLGQNELIREAVST